MGNYSDQYYDRQVAKSYGSATQIIGLLTKHLQPKSAVDIGCGRGAWLKALKDTGTSRLCGVDGPWNDQSDMIDDDIAYQQKDLNKPQSITFSETFDLAVSLEVAEHLLPENSEAFVKLLTSLSDVVLFSAAFLRQRGTGHINEREHSFWASLYVGQGFRPYDLFRPVFWGNPDVDYWYQQNCFLYVKEGSALDVDLIAKGIQPLENLKFMDCVHPDLFDRYQKPFLSRLVTSLKNKRSTYKSKNPK